MILNYVYDVTGFRTRQVVKILVIERLSNHDKANNLLPIQPDLRTV